MEGIRDDSVEQSLRHLYRGPQSQQEPRILAPTGHIGFVPEENLQAALDAGAVVVTSDKMREIRQAIFMQHAVFKDAHKPIQGRRRKSLIKKSR